MKIGILTFHWANNYGAVLQAYGLYQVLRKLGHNATFINYIPTCANKWWQRLGIRRGWRRYPYVIQRLRFIWFRFRELPKSYRCRKIQELRTMALDFNAIIVGSDQVWNGNIYKGFDGVYFLDFVDRPECRKISYSACFGDVNQPRETVESAGALLMRFDSLSVRNEMSANLVRNFSGREAEIVLDPSFLHDYEELLDEKNRKQPYVAAYFLSTLYRDRGEGVLYEIKKHLQHPVIVTGDEQQAVDCDYSQTSAGPKEWIRLIKNATYVCTDSFHGVVFAIKFKKPFIAWSGYRPERIKHLLKICGLEDRVVAEADPGAVKRLLETQIDYNAVSEKLQPYLKRSRLFLERSLKT